MSTLLDQFLMDQRGVIAESTRRQYRWVLAKVDLPMPMEDARIYRDRRLDEVSPATVCVELRALKCFDRWYADEHAEQPLLGRLRFPKVKVRDDAPICTKAQKDALLATCDETMLGLRDAAVIELLWCTGMRRSECVRLLLTDVDMALLQVHLRETKNGSSRHAAIDKVTLRRIRLYLKARKNAGVLSEHLWTGTKGPLTVSGITELFKKRSALAGVTVSAHQFRRGCATRWMAKGGSETLLREILGWRSPTMVARYIRASRTELALTEQRRLARIPD